MYLPRRSLSYYSLRVPLLYQIGTRAIANRSQIELWKESCATFGATRLLLLLVVVGGWWLLVVGCYRLLHCLWIVCATTKAPLTPKPSAPTDYASRFCFRLPHHVFLKHRELQTSVAGRASRIGDGNIVAHRWLALDYKP